MKRIATTLVIAALAATFAATAAADDSPFPRTLQGDTYSQYQIFPGMPTYESQHRASEPVQAEASPAGLQESPLASESPASEISEDVLIIVIPAASPDGGVGATD